jgi:hypothetical protein
MTQTSTPRPGRYLVSGKVGGSKFESTVTASDFDGAILRASEIIAQFLPSDGPTKLKVKRLGDARSEQARFTVSPSGTRIHDRVAEGYLKDPDTGKIAIFKPVDAERVAAQLNA